MLSLQTRLLGLPTTGMVLLWALFAVALLYSLGLVSHWTTGGLVSPEVTGNVANVPAFLLSGTFVCYIGRKHTHNSRLAWIFLGLGLLVYGGGNALWAYLRLVLHVEPFPSIADAAYLTFPFSLALSFRLLPRRATTRGELVRLWLDVAVIVASAGLFTWRFLLAPMLDIYVDQRFALAVAIAYPLLDLMLLSLLLLLTFERRLQLPPASAFWLGVGLLGWISADFSFVALTGRSSYYSGHPIDIFWVGGSVAFALAALCSLSPVAESPAQSEVADPYRMGAWLKAFPHQWSPVKPYLPYAAVAGGFVLLITLYGENSRASWGVLWGVVGLTALVIARQVLALHENARLNDELRAWSGTLEQRVEERTGQLGERSKELEERTRELETLSVNLEVIVEERTAELEASRSLLAHQAHHDTLTGLPNRALFEDRLQLAVAGAARRGTKVAVLFIDLDGFKFVNDTLGHATGDQLLRAVAERLRSRLRTTDTIARFGGDEFAVVLPDLHEEKHADMVARALLSRLCAPVKVGNHHVQVGASIGVSLYPQDGPDMETLQKHADVAMYRVKASGKNDVFFFSPEMNAAAIERMELEKRLHGALERREFVLHYQPQFDGEGQKLTGFEALLRWTHPEVGNISPARFVPVLEETGLIVPVGAWVLDEACRQLTEWKRLFPESLNDLQMAVNVSPIQFARPEFVHLVEEAIERHQLCPQSLELELTEGMVVRDIEGVSRKMVQLRALGARISIDDFGAGHSALSYLLRLPVDALKIDRAFVQDLDRTPGAQRVVSAIVVLSHALGLRVVAEGVETQDQMAILRDFHCEHTQGFLLGRPVCAENAQELLATFSMV